MCEEPSQPTWASASIHRIGRHLFYLDLEAFDRFSCGEPWHLVKPGIFINSGSTKTATTCIGCIPPSKGRRSHVWVSTLSSLRQPFIASTHPRIVCGSYDPWNLSLTEAYVSAHEAWEGCMKLCPYTDVSDLGHCSQFVTLGQIDAAGKPGWIRQLSAPFPEPIDPLPLCLKQYYHKEGSNFPF